jgi:signal peptidase II
MLYLIFAALAAVLDQLFKHWIVRVVAPGAVKTLIPGVIHLTNIQNTGAAFSILPNMRWVLVAVSAIAVVALCIIIIKYPASWWHRLAMGALLGGAFGNLIDRVLSGYVVDMFEFEFVSFAVFNIADVFVTLGAIFTLIAFLLPEKSKKRRASKPADGTSDAPDVADAAPQVFDEDSPLTETRILEEYDLERRLREYDDTSGGQ